MKDKHHLVEMLRLRKDERYSAEVLAREIGIRPVELLHRWLQAGREEHERMREIMNRHKS